MNLTINDVEKGDIYQHWNEKYYMIHKINIKDKSFIAKIVGKIDYELTSHKPEDIKEFFGRYKK